MNEIPNVRQVEGEPRRRWFVGAGIDLIVWFDQRDSITEFQLCNAAIALSWNKCGMTTARVDDGEQAGGPKLTPILKPETGIDCEDLVRQFKAEANTLPPEIAGFVSRQLS